MSKGRRCRGAVDQLPSGRWRARFRTDDGDRVSRIFDTSADADAWLSIQVVDTARGAWIDPRAGQVPFEEFAKVWMEQRPDLRPRTSELYQGLLDRHIVPAFGDVDIASIKPSAIRAWHATLARRHQSTAAKAYRLLRTMMNTAVDDEQIARNPCRVEGGGVERAPERPIASIAEAQALADAMVDHLRAVVLLAFWCGLRWGELTALQRRDVDLLHHTVAVERTHYRINGRLEVGPPKTDASYRRVAIPPHVVPDITEHLDRFVGRGRDALLFTGVKGGPLTPGAWQAAWSDARLAVGLPHLHLHDLRGSGNTLAAATGASTKELMARMGHASARAALLYQHATADRDRVIAAAMSDLAKQAEVTPIKAPKDDVPEGAGSRLGHGGSSGASRTTRRKAKKAV